MSSPQRPANPSETEANDGQAKECKGGAGDGQSNRQRAHSEPPASRQRRRERASRRAAGGANQWPTPARPPGADSHTAGTEGYAARRRQRQPATVQTTTQDQQQALR